MSDATLRWQAQRIAELEEQVRQLRAEVGHIAPDGIDMQVMRLRAAMRVKPGEARVLLALNAAKAGLTAKQLHKRACPNADSHPHLMSVHICRLRRLFGRDIIETTLAGYRLTPDGRELVQDALNPKHGRAA